MLRCRAQYYKNLTVNHCHYPSQRNSHTQVQHQILNNAWDFSSVQHEPRNQKTHAVSTRFHSRLAASLHPSSAESSRAPKSILVFCDGTGKDALITEPMRAKTHDDHFTNVLRLSRSVTKTFNKGDHLMQQIAYYQSGIGRATGFTARGRYIYESQKAFGTAVAARIRDAYNFIAQNYAEGDQICIFGFSRGAYTARKLSGLIERLGLLSPAEMGHFFTYWKQLNDVRSGEPPRPAKPVPIKCVGTWDTVGSVDDGSGPKIDALRLKDSNMPPNVEIALHAVSFHENRCKFPCMLYTGLTSPSQTLKQVWFPGAHADVGGGYAQHELADISLAWMVGEIESFVGVDHTFVESLISTNAEKRPWGESVPRDAYATTPGIIRRWVLGQKSRLPFLTSDSKFHPSLLVSPDTEKLLTISNLKEQMPGWNPEEHVVELNNFERRVKEIWHDVPRDGKEPPKVEGSEDLESMFELAPLVDWLLILLDKFPRLSHWRMQRWQSRSTSL